jgi:hypothetical protein
MTGGPTVGKFVTRRLGTLWHGRCCPALSMDGLRIAIIAVLLVLALALAAQAAPLRTLVVAPDGEASVKVTR